MIRRCIPWPDPRLRRPAETVEAITDEIRAHWRDMIDTMEAMPGVGLAPTARCVSSCVSSGNGRI